MTGPTDSGRPEALDRRRARVVLAPDKFKGSLTAAEAAHAMELGVRASLEHVDITSIPIADGGDGTVSVLAGAGGHPRTAGVTGPLGEQVDAVWLTLGDIAYIEVAEACGLRHIPSPSPSTALNATSRGVGELVLAALEGGAARIVLALGGSASSDGGTGMASALGARFLDAAGHDLSDGAGPLADLAAIDLSGLDDRLGGVTITAACDVDSPLIGRKGAAHLFSAQKGADRSTAELIEQSLAVLATHLDPGQEEPISTMAGAGAAGGLGAGAVAFLSADLRSGSDLVLDLLDFDRHVAGADLLITGEGLLDEQTLGGKAPMRATRRAQLLGVPTAIIVGRQTLGPAQLEQLGWSAVRTLLDVAGSEREAIADAARLVAGLAGDVSTELLDVTRKGS